MVDIPIYRKNEVVAYVNMDNHNLNLNGVPSYVNEGGHLSLKRIARGRFKGKLVLLYYDQFFPSSSFGEFISEEDAYELCRLRGKYRLIRELGIILSD